MRGMVWAMSYPPENYIITKYVILCKTQIGICVNNEERRPWLQ